MATRGMIARRTPDGAEGVYHHWDSYPEGLGCALWNAYHGPFHEDVGEMLRVLVDEHSAWSTIVDADWDYAPGFVDYGDPDGRRPQCYCHGDRSESTSPTHCRDDADRPGWCLGDDPSAVACDPHSTEWVYVLDAGGLEIRTSWAAPPNYTMPEHRVLARVAWTDPEPDWGELAETARTYTYHEPEPDEPETPAPDFSRVERRWVDAAEAARIMRKHLREVFPGVRFWVRTDKYAGGASVRVYADLESEDQETADRIAELVAGYEGGGFDGMIDMAYSAYRWADEHGRPVELAYTPGTEGSRGVVPRVENPAPRDGLELVRYGCDYVFFEPRAPWDVRVKREETGA